MECGQKFPEQALCNGCAAKVEVTAGHQSPEVSAPIGLREVSQAVAVRGDLTTTTANRVTDRVRSVCAVRPGRWWRRVGRDGGGCHAHWDVRDPCLVAGGGSE